MIYIYIYIYIYIPYTDSLKVGYIIIRGANETRQLSSYSDSTRSKLGQNSTRVSSTRARARLEMLTSRVELGSSKLDSSSSSTQNINDSTRAQLNLNLTHIISTPMQRE